MYETYFDIYKELKKQYRIAHSSNVDLTEYDIVVQHIGSGYAHAKYRVIKNAPHLSTKDLAIICDKGNLCFGYRSEGGIICVYTD